MKPMQFTAAAAFILLGLAALPALHTGAAAQDGPLGVAFVEAPEQGSGMCFSQNADRGFECARQQCMESGAEARDCLRVKWCFPAGWSADVFVQHKEGPHWHVYLCGWQAEADLDAAIEIVCQGSAAKYLMECAMAGKWDANGARVDAQ